MRLGFFHYGLLFVRASVESLLTARAQFLEDFNKFLEVESHCVELAGVSVVKSISEE